MSNTVKFQRTSDLGLVKSIMTNPALYPWLSDDTYPPPAEFWPNPSENIHYMIAYNQEILGLFITHPLTSVLWQVHHAILPEHHKRTNEIARAFTGWLFSSTPCQTMVGFTPACNRAGRIFAVRHGMTRAGVIPNAYPKGGKLHDMVIFIKSKK